MKRPKILFASYVDANDMVAMAGIPYHMSCALQEHCGDVNIVSPVDDAVIRAGTIVRRFARVIGQQRDGLGNVAVSKLIARNIRRCTSREKYDFVFVGYGHTVAASLQLDCPLVYASDTTYSQVSSYYNLGKQPIGQIWSENNLLEQRAINNASLLLYPSEFAATSALTEYGCLPKKVHVVPFGANIASVPDTATVHQAISARATSDTCRLLFIGKDWERKGGAIALETFYNLEKMNIPVEITFLGSGPLEPVFNKNIKFIPLLNKNITQDAQQFSDLLLSANFFLLPTRAEQFGIVFCEASAYGIPSITTNTGGVGSAVEDDVNGYKLPMEAKGADYAECIARIFSKAQSYTALATSSRERYDTLLNWNSWGKSVSKIMANL